MQPPKPNPIAGIERGSVFLLARWSGPCVSARNYLQHAWSAAGLPDSELHPQGVFVHWRSSITSELRLVPDRERREAKAPPSRQLLYTPAESLRFPLPASLRDSPSPN